MKKILCFLFGHKICEWVKNPKANKYCPFHAYKRVGYTTCVRCEKEIHIGV